MKVLLINKYHFLKGGAERAYFDMARILTERGHEVAFFSMRHPKNEATYWEKYFVGNAEYEDTKTTLWQKFRLAGKALFNVEAKQKLEQLIDEFQPDIAHLHNIYHQLSPSIFFALKKRGIPVVMTLHDYKLVSPNYNLFVRGKVWEHTSGFRCIADRCVKDSMMKSAVCAAEQWLHAFLRSYGKADIFVAPSRFLIEKFHALGFRREIMYLPHPLAKAAENTGIVQREEDAFLFFGRLSQEKGIDTAIEALALLPEENKLWIVGDGPDRKRLETLVQERHMAGRVTFFGSRYGKDLEDFKRRAQAVILPSRWYENFPYAMIESLQSGCVVVAAQMGGIAERIADGENGMLFEAGNARALADTIRSLRHMPLDAMRMRAKESVRDLTEEIFVSQLMRLYASLLPTRMRASKTR